MDLRLNPFTMAFVKLKLFLLTLISSAFRGDGCVSDLSIVTSPGNASILQGWNYTFLCNGNGTYLDWEINGKPSAELSEDSILKVVNAHVMSYGDVCIQESMMTVHAESAPEDNTLSIFAIQCVIRKFHFVPVVAEAYLKVHVIGGAGDVELISPASLEGPAVIQWKGPDVLSGSSLPLYYNITVRDPSNQIIAQNTTTDTSFAIGSELLVPCYSYELTLLPFQQISGHTELGVMTEETLLPPPLPPTNVNLSVSLRPDSAWVTIYFQAQHTNGSLQWPENFIVTVMQQGTDDSETFQSPEQTVMGMENVYTLEKLHLRQKYQLSIKLGCNVLSSIAEIANFSTFNVQNLTLMEQEGGRELNVHCDMANGAEDKNCTVMMKSETGVVQRNCFPTGGRNATCKLSGLALGQYVIQGYDRELEETPAVEYPFFLTKELSEDLTNTAPTTRTDDTTTLEGSPRFQDEEAVQNDLIVGIVTPLILILTIGLVTIIVALIVVKFHSKKQKDYHLDDSAFEAAHSEVHVYHMAEENEYHKHNIPQQQDTHTESTVVQEPAYDEAQPPTGGNGYDEDGLPWQQNAVHESTDVQEPACADAQIVISTTTTNNSHNQYRELRKEWLADLHLEGPTSPHTPSFSHPPDSTSF